MALYRTIVVSAYIIFLCNMAISYHHALEFFRNMVGFPGFFAHVAVVGVDTLFAVSSLVISNAITRQIEIGFPVWFCFSFGFAFTEWSNVRACWDDGWEGIIAGSAPVFALLCIKFLLSWMTANKYAFASSHTVGESHKTSQGDSCETLRESSQPPKVSQPHISEDSHNAGESHNKQHKESPNASREESRLQSDTESNTGAPKESHKEPRDESRSPHSESHSSHTEPHTTPRDPREVALKIYHKTGDLPSIRGLMTEAGCKEWPARTTLRDLRKELGLEEPKKRKRKVVG